MGLCWDLGMGLLTDRWKFWRYRDDTKASTVKGWSTLGVNSAEVRLPLSDNVFITAGVFNNRPLISIRQFYSRDSDPNTLKPGKKGLTFTPEQWRTLKDMSIYGAIIDKTFEALPAATVPKPRTFYLGSLKYAVVEMIDGQPTVGLWQYDRLPGINNNEPVRTQKGINLTLQQWEGVESKKETVDWIMDAVAKGKSPLDVEVIEGIPI
ncbi:hypothetical protein Bbelb_292310 [Branchiostoma belcheri]|nr:hypothetical protein Bbelb_292310 [Branchiostoma belcheri]